MLPSIKKLFQGKNSTFVFQQDGAPPHTAIRTQVALDMEGINVLTWPPNSPDLSPIENVWAIIKERLSLRYFRSFEAYKKGLIEEWDNLE